MARLGGRQTLAAPAFDDAARIVWESPPSAGALFSSTSPLRATSAQWWSLSQRAAWNRVAHRALAAAAMGGAALQPDGASTQRRPTHTPLQTRVAAIREQTKFAQAHTGLNCGRCQGSQANAAVPPLATAAPPPTPPSTHLSSSPLTQNSSSGTTDEHHLSARSRAEGSITKKQPA